MSLPPDGEHKKESGTRGVKLGRDTDKVVEMGSALEHTDNVAIPK